jgi:hypothetical protein
MIEASILFKLHNTSILDMYKVFEHIDMLSIDILSNSLNRNTALRVRAGMITFRPVGFLHRN